MKLVEGVSVREIATNFNSPEDDIVPILGTKRRKSLKENVAAETGPA
jgi:aryl-alcohol dehydrogenase-like predicted oxidoreductase